MAVPLVNETTRLSSLQTNETGSPNKIALQLEHLSAGYGRALALQDITASIERGQRVGLVGHNGAGKSTLFKAIVGLLVPSGGQIIINGESAREARQAAAYVPQFEDVDWAFPVSVMDVVVMGLARQI